MAQLKSDGKMIFMIFVGLIITAVFMTVIADQVFLQTNTPTVTNLSVTVPAVNTTLTTQLPGRQNTTVIVVTNGTGTFTNNFSVNTSNAAGVLGVFWFPTDAATTEAIVGNPVNLTFTYQPSGYLQDSGARSVAGLVLIMAALAMVVFVVVIIFKSGSLGEMMATFNRRRSR